MGRGWRPGRAIPSTPAVYAKNRVVADGEDNFDTVAAALNAATDAVILGPGTYAESIDITTADLTMIGSGNATLIDGGTAGSAITVSASGVMVRDLAVSTDGGQGNSYHGVEVNAANANIQNVTVEDADADGMNVSATDCLVSDSRVESCDEEAYDFEAGSTGSKVSFSHALSNVTTNGFTSNSNEVEFSACHADSVGGNGFNISGDDCVVDACYSVSAGSAGINCQGDTETSITSNRIKGATNSGITTNGTRPSIVGNIVTGSGGSDIDVTSATNPTVRANQPDTAESLSAQAKVNMLLDSPNGHVMNAVLDNGDSAEISVPVPDGETLKVYRWGAYQITDGTTPGSLDCELKDGADTVQTTENTGDTESSDPTAPVASNTNGTGSSSIYKLAVSNDTGGAIADPGVGAFFAYIVE